MYSKRVLEIVDNRHLAQDLIADVVEAESEIHLVARLGKGRGGDLDQAQARIAGLVDRVDILRFPRAGFHHCGPAAEDHLDGLLARPIQRRIADTQQPGRFRFGNRRPGG